MDALTPEQQAAQDKAIADAVSAAVAPLQAQIDSGVQAEVVQKAVDEAVAPLQAELTAANSREAAAVQKLADFTAEAEAFKAQLNELDAAEATRKAEQAEADRLATVEAARFEVLTSAVDKGGLAWTPEAATPRAKAYAELSDEAWAGVLADLRSTAAAAAATAPPVPQNLGLGTGASVVGGSPVAPPAAAAAGQEGTPTPATAAALAAGGGQVPAGIDPRTALVLGRGRRNAPVTAG